jgi:membrane associated rhomboid family serine protease
VPTVGASGAVFGISSGFWFVVSKHRNDAHLFTHSYQSQVFYFSIYIFWELYRGMSMADGDNVAHFAHLGGALVWFYSWSNFGIEIEIFCIEIYSG